jgi:hypothetical protein
MYVEPMRGSPAMPSSTSDTSTPYSSASAATSLTKLSFNARKPLATFLIISAAAPST